jgi:2-amino-4-hydroxy-6-hydroxymethyldihydropteridine diphosphokinase
MLKRNVMKTYLSLGSNIYDREHNIEDALDRIIENIGVVTKSSSYYETEPWGFQSDESFLNIAVEVETDLSPDDLMETITKIENRMGRIRDEKVRYTSRIIDIDILLYGDMVINDANLTIPHPRMHERNFVLEPLDEIAPGVVHPVFEKPVSELLDTCSDTGAIRKLATYPKIHA